MTVRLETAVTSHAIAALSTSNCAFSTAGDGSSQQCPRILLSTSVGTKVATVAKWLAMHSAK